MKSLNNGQVFYAFAPDMQPQLTVSQGETFVLETLDCYGGQLKNTGDTMDSMEWNTTNPATGPVYVEGIKAGDIIRINIESLKLTGNTVMATIPGSGKVKGICFPETTIMDNSSGDLVIPTACGELSIPVKPMIGVIGVAPAEGSFSNGVPDAHGGNMDCKLIGEGTALYLHANVDGALFGCGDVHSLMGDGEVVVCGGETPAEITLSIDKVCDVNMKTPFLVTEDLYAAIASSTDLETAYQQAIDNMYFFLSENTGLPSGDIGRLMSLVGELKFCQVVDPEYTVRFEFPRAVLAKLGCDII